MSKVEGKGAGKEELGDVRCGDFGAFLWKNSTRYGGKFDFLGNEDGENAAQTGVARMTLLFFEK